MRTTRTINIKQLRGDGMIDKIIIFWRKRRARLQFFILKRKIRYAYAYSDNFEHDLYERTKDMLIVLKGLSGTLDEDFLSKKTSKVHEIRTRTDMELGLKELDDMVDEVRREL